MAIVGGCISWLFIFLDGKRYGMEMNFYNEYLGIFLALNYMNAFSKSLISLSSLFCITLSIMLSKRNEGSCLSFWINLVS